MTQREFDESLLGVYASLHDLHTGVRKSGRRGRATAVLPVLVERYGPPRRGQHLVTKLAPWAEAGALVPGSILTHWNGIPIDVAVARHADRARGANPDARLARAMDTLTVRHLGDGMAPDEHWVDLRFRTPDRKVAETRLYWRVLSLGVPEGRTAVGEVFDLALGPARPSDPRLQLAFDPAGQSAAGGEAGALRRREAVGRRDDPARGLPGDAADLPPPAFGHIRVGRSCTRTRAVRRRVQPARAALRTGTMRRAARRHPGQPRWLRRVGRVVAAVAGGGSVGPARFAFAPTRLTGQLCANDPELAAWLPSIEAAVDTGEPYSQALPITEATAVDIEKATDLPSALIIDALSYSSADIFAAGWVDNAVGPIVGTSATTGAGGANVWTYEQITARLDQDDLALPPACSVGRACASPSAARCGRAHPTASRSRTSAWASRPRTSTR